MNVMGGHRGRSLCYSHDTLDALGMFCICRVSEIVTVQSGVLSSMLLHRLVRIAIEGHSGLLARFSSSFYASK